MTDMNTVILDWHPPSEERRAPSQPFRLGAAEPLEASVIRSKDWNRKAWLDQMREGACTGFGLGHVLSGGTLPWVISDAHAKNFYYGARRYDQWAGEAYEGSSVHGVMDYAKKAGLITGYNWAETADELVAAVQKGPVELGTYVYTGWFSPDSDGTIRNTGVREGGHAYALGGVDLRKGRAEIWQSWGRDHGDNGTVYLDLEELFRLLVDENGEAALPRRKKYNPRILDHMMITQI